MISFDFGFFLDLDSIKSIRPVLINTVIYRVSKAFMPLELCCCKLVL